MSLSIGILSWGARKTLINSLDSYRKYGLDDPAIEKIIFFQEITDEDRKIAKDYGYQAEGSSTNIGIANGYKSLVAAVSGGLFLFLENDWEMIEPKDALYEGAYLLEQEVTDVVRLRHRKNPGNPLWSRVYQGRELDGPHFILDSIHWLDDPTIFNPITYNANFYWTSASSANWTNNPTMFRSTWLREVIVPRMGAGDVEIDIQSWWGQQEDIRVVQHETGIFTHNRLDR